MSSLSDRLTSSRVRELTALLLRVEFPAPTRKIVEPLLELLVGGGTFDLTQNFLIREPAALLLLLELLPSLSDELQLELWSTLGAVLHQCLPNTSSCHQLGLTDKCLEYLAKTKNDRIASHIGTVLEILAGYSISVKQLKSILSYLYNSSTDTNWAPHSVLLISVLNNISISLQPDVFFSFSGGHGAIFALPPLSKWPSQSGFTISTWIRCEKPYDSQRDYFKPILYWFRTGRGSGYSAHFVGNTLVLETVGKNVKKPQTHPVDHIFHSYQWHMVTVVYYTHRLRSSEVYCYVDGILSLSAEVTLPSHDEVYDKCFLGGNHVATPDSVFQGQMSALYIWKEPLGKEIVSVLHKLGPKYKSQFKFEAEVDIPLSPKQQKLLFDGHLASSLVISYNAKAVDGQLCLEASPVESHSFFAHSPHATMLEGVEPVVTTSIHSALHSLGGIQALFPLFSQLDTPQYTASKSTSSSIDYSLSVKLLSLVFELARNSITYMFQLVQMRALELISYLLEKVSASHLTEELLSTIFDFMRYLSTASYGEELLLHLVEQLLFNSRLWIRASKKVQIFLYSHLATEFCMQRLGTTSLDLREIIGVSQLMFILKEHYSLTGTESKRSHRDIRPYLLLMVKQFVTKGKGILQVELVSILNYLLSVPEEENLFDVLQLLIALVFEDTNASLIKLLKNSGGLKVAARLLACGSEEIRINALKLVNKVLHHSTDRERSSIIETDGLFTVIREKLLSTGQPVTIPMFNTLLQLLLNQPSRRVIESHFFTVDTSHSIVFAGVLPVMVAVIDTLNVSHVEDKNDSVDTEESLTEQQQSMTLQLLAYVNSLCSQSNQNCIALLNVPEWQELLLKLCDDSEDADSIQALVHQIFHTVLMYAIREEEEGWRLWTQTAATIHNFRVRKGLVSYRPSLSARSIDEPSTPTLNRADIGTVDSQSSLTPQSIRALSRPRAASKTRSSEEDDFELESQSDISLTDYTKHTETELGVSPLVESTAQTASASTTQTASTSTAQTASTGAAGTPSSSSGLKRKYPKFQWSTEHWTLFKRILNSVEDILDKGRSDSDGGSAKLSDILSDRTMSHLLYNTAQLLVLSIDSFISIVGGIKSLMSECCGINKRRRRGKAIEEDITKRSSSHAERLLRQCLKLADTLILSGRLKFLEIEARMNMEPGGVIKQCLRLIFAVASLDCIKANSDYEDQQNRYHKHKIAIEQMRLHSKTLLKVVGIADSSLDKYISTSLESKLVSLKDCQLLLSEEHVSRLHRVIPKDLENRSLVQPIVSSIIYYLSVLCVARYKAVLDSVEKERADLSLPRRHRSMSESSGSPQLSLNLELAGKDSEDSPPPPLTPDVSATTRLSRTDSLDSGSVASASDLIKDRSMSLQFFGTEGVLHPPTVVPLNQAVDVSEQVSVSLRIAGACLCQLLVDNKSTLSKVLTTADGRNLLSDAALKLAEKNSTVEITMLLCSQEWQIALQKTAAKFFNSLLAEGKHSGSFSEMFIRGLSMKVSQEVRSVQEVSREMFTKFEEELSLFLSETVKASHEDRKMKRAEVLRHTQTAETLWRKLSPMVDNCGSFDFTPLKPSLLWRLSMKEDAHRRKLKMLPNPSGSTHAEALRSLADQQNQQKDSTFDPNLLPSPLPQEEEKLAEDEGEILIEAADNKEVPQVTLECGIVALAYFLSGTLSFTNYNFTFTADDSTPEYNKVASIADSCPLSDQWNFSDVTAVFSRYYMHQFKALEIFFANKSSVFVVCKDSGDMRTVVKLLPKVGIGSQYGLPQTRSISLSQPRQLFRKSDMTEKWIKREISNFDYLMFLNTIAGRSFNDLSQYPVFPWILKDYSSRNLDLRDPSVYRDLSKPIGALNPSRLLQYKERYELWESDTIPSFHYGTHYSTMAFVVHWLVRVEPFTSIHIDLHDGFFDHGSRLFSSVARAWNNCQVDSSDVKELIPELFFLPEMFLNDNKFLLGYDEHGELGDELPNGEVRVVSDVLLPAWAESAEEFVHIHRRALESDYVSSNLHQWIDLIFGYKQTGPEAIEEANVFYHVTYPGSVNWKAITDEYQLKALEQQVLQFGQTPHQLLKEPHPQRLASIKEFPPQPKSKHNPAIVAEIDVSLDVPIGCVHLSSSVSSSSLLAITYNQLFAVYKWTCVPGTASQPPLINLELDQTNAANLKVRLGDPLDQTISVSSKCFETTPTGNFMFLCGFWDSSFKVFSTDTSTAVQSVFGHRGIVTCISFSIEDGLNSFNGDGLIATGSSDVTVLIWRWSGRLNRVVSQLTTPQGSVTPLAILNGHEKTITCVAVSASLGLVASGAKQGCCLLHSTSGELLHKLVPTNPWNHPHIITSCPTQGHFVVHYADQKGCLAVYSCNGRQLCYRALGEPALAMALSQDGHHLIIGGFSAHVYVLDTQSLEIVYTYDQCESSIRALHMSHDHRFIFVGLSSGIVSVVATHFWRQ